MAIPNKPTGRNVNWGEKGFFFLSLEQLGKGREKENSIFSTPENSKLGKEERGENLGTGKTGINPRNLKQLREPWEYFHSWFSPNQHIPGFVPRKADPSSFFRNDNSILGNDNFPVGSWSSWGSVPFPPLPPQDPNPINPPGLICISTELICITSTWRLWN